ncbi:DUF2922 domain-containing protein [Halalkalibacter krulwichiae]|uniref:DUF2922 domain-containing protein n=1 Tax=Halalkalibacter krulwichiae TaxID=199441 RepID=A0A1X9MIR7_9BACI|nr:DUF2922 domain-containing protein [Halalkalibacter krulwichiae]ARK32694.1 hypothetical protein BkAM31D_24125 [Halalkalibacter krulwichiae]
MSKRLELIFENEMGGNITLTLDNPVHPANPAAVSAAMDAIVMQNAFISTGGEIVGKKSARFVDRTVEEIEI